MAQWDSGRLDDALAGLRAMNAPSVLAAMDDGVIAGVHARLRDQASARRSLSLACAVAVVVGIGSGMAVPAREARADTALLAMPARAPSQLLGE